MYNLFDGIHVSCVSNFQLLNPDVLPGYHFRDDAILIYNAINKYVKKYVDLYYGE